MRSWICDYRLIRFSNTFWIRLQAWPGKKKKKRFLWFIFSLRSQYDSMCIKYLISVITFERDWHSASDTDVEQACSERISKKNQYSTCILRCVFETCCHHIRHARASIMLTIKLLKAFPKVFVLEKWRGTREKIGFLLSFFTKDSCLLETVLNFCSQFAMQDRMRHWDEASKANCQNKENTWVIQQYKVYGN